MLHLVVWPITIATSRALSNLIEQESHISNPLFRAKAIKYALSSRFSKIHNAGIVLMHTGEQKFSLADFDCVAWLLGT